MRIYQNKEELMTDILNALLVDAVEDGSTTVDTPVVRIGVNHFGEGLNCQDIGDSVEMIDWYGYRELSNKEYKVYSSFILTETTSSRNIAEFLWDNDLVNKSVRFGHNFKDVDDVLTKLYLSTKDDFYGASVVRDFFQEYGVEEYF